jgi:hypothetical protein
VLFRTVDACACAESAKLQPPMPYSRLQCQVRGLFAARSFTRATSMTEALSVKRLRTHTLHPVPEHTLPQMLPGTICICRTPAGCCSLKPQLCQQSSSEGKQRLGWQPTSTLQHSWGWAIWAAWGRGWQVSRSRVRCQHRPALCTLACIVRAYEKMIQVQIVQTHTSSTTV